MTIWSKTHVCHIDCHPTNSHFSNEDSIQIPFINPCWAPLKSNCFDGLPSNVWWYPSKTFFLQSPVNLIMFWIQKQAFPLDYDPIINLNHSVPQKHIFTWQSVAYFLLALLSLKWLEWSGGLVAMGSKVEALPPGEAAITRVLYNEKKAEW